MPGGQGCDRAHGASQPPHRSRPAGAGGPKLRFVASPTTGLNHIDLAAAEAAGIAMLSLQGERAFLDRVPATAEHSWAPVAGAVAAYSMGPGLGA